MKIEGVKMMRIIEIALKKQQQSSTTSTALGGTGLRSKRLTGRKSFYAGFDPGQIFSYTVMPAPIEAPESLSLASGFLDAPLQTLLGRSGPSQSAGRLLRTTGPGGYWKMYCVWMWMMELFEALLCAIIPSMKFRTCCVPCSGFWTVGIRYGSH